MKDDQITRDLNNDNAPKYNDTVTCLFVGMSFIVTNSLCVTRGIPEYCFLSFLTIRTYYPVVKIN